MSKLQLKLIALSAMFLDHIAYFFPYIPISLIFHWIGRISAPIFIFCVIDGLKKTYSKQKYILRLYLASIIMAIVQLNTQIELNFFRTLFIIACISEVLEYKKNIEHIQWIKVFFLYLTYQSVSCIICAYAIIHSNMYTETLSFFLIPALLGSLFDTEGGLIFIILGILMYLNYNNKKTFIISYIIFIVLYMMITTTSIISIILYKIKIFPIIGDMCSNIIEGFLSEIIGINLMYIGSNIFKVQYQWGMIFALPIILLYNYKQGEKYKYFFYFFYPIHIFLFWLISNLL